MSRSVKCLRQGAGRQPAKEDKGQGRDRKQSTKALIHVYCEDVATPATSFNFTIRDMISDQEVHKSRGLVIVYSYAPQAFDYVPDRIPPGILLWREVVIHVENGV